MSAEVCVLVLEQVSERLCEVVQRKIQKNWESCDPEQQSRPCEADKGQARVSTVRKTESREQTTWTERKVAETGTNDSSPPADSLSLSLTHKHTHRHTDTHTHTHTQLLWGDLGLQQKKLQRKRKMQRFHRREYLENAKTELTLLSHAVIRLCDWKTQTRKTQSAVKGICQHVFPHFVIFLLNFPTTLNSPVCLLWLVSLPRYVIFELRLALYVISELNMLTVVISYRLPVHAPCCLHPVSSSSNFCLSAL